MNKKLKKWKSPFFEIPDVSFNSVFLANLLRRQNEQGSTSISMAAKETA